MTETRRRRLARLLVATGVAIAVFSIIAESLGFGSGNGEFGTWQQGGLLVGLCVIVAGTLLWARPEPTWPPPERRATRPAPSETTWVPPDPPEGRIKDSLVVGSLFLALVVAGAAFWLAVEGWHPTEADDDPCITPEGYSLLCSEL